MFCAILWGGFGKQRFAASTCPGKAQDASNPRLFIGRALPDQGSTLGLIHLTSTRKSPCRNRKATVSHNPILIFEQPCSGFPKGSSKDHLLGNGLFESAISAGIVFQGPSGRKIRQPAKCRIHPKSDLFRILGPHPVAGLVLLGQLLVLFGALVPRRNTNSVEATVPLGGRSGFSARRTQHTFRLMSRLDKNQVPKPCSEMPSGFSWGK